MSESDQITPVGDDSDELAPSATVSRAERKVLRAQKRAQAAAAKEQAQSERRTARQESKAVRAAKRERRYALVEHGLQRVGQWLTPGPVSLVLVAGLIALFVVGMVVGREY